TLKSSSGVSPPPVPNLPPIGNKPTSPFPAPIADCAAAPWTPANKIAATRKAAEPLRIDIICESSPLPDPPDLPAFARASGLRATPGKRDLPLELVRNPRETAWQNCRDLTERGPDRVGHGADCVAVEHVEDIQLER